VIPRKLWIYWHQGMPGAPFVVRKCVDSWIEQNPAWDVVVLDRRNLGGHLALDFPEGRFAKLPLEKQSNLIRLQLLSDHGGVWADATSLCMSPLDTWIDAHIASGFFAFSNPGPDRIMANWFLASEKGNPLVARLRDRYAAFFMEHDFRTDGWFGRKVRKRLKKLLNRSEKTTKYWFSPLVTKVLRVYPYYVFHYLFERLISEDPASQRIWNETRKLGADGPLKVLAAGLLSPLDSTLKREIDEKRAPLYKLSWKYDAAGYAPTTALHYLLEGRRQTAG